MAQTSDREEAPRRADKAANKKNGESETLARSFDAALSAAASAPASEEAWDHLEELADTLQRPDEVAAAYREALDGELDREAWTAVSRRAAQFHDEWFGDNPEAMHALLSRILERDPDATWAFDRLSMVLTVGERWDDLLGLYDQLLQHTPDPAKRKRLLSDAAHTAKDFAHKPGRAVDYMQLQLELEPSNDKLAQGIERLLQRQSRWEDLVELWQNRLADMPSTSARQTRLKIARAFLDHLDTAAPALEELRTLVDESPGHEEACAELERVLAGPDFPVPVRMGALALLRTNYRAAARPDDAVAAVQTALTFAAGPERITLQREAGQRLAILGKDDGALTHYAQLLREEPTDADARRQLRQLARRSGRFEAQADALVAATDDADPAQAAALLVEAAHLHREQLEDPERAIELYRKAVELADADPAGALTAAHHLNELLAAAGRPNERLDVLERLADLEQASVVRRAVLGEAGKLAAELDDPDRALRAYQRRIDADAHDLEALDAVVNVLDTRERWEPLCDALQRRADAVSVHQQRRADLVRLARIQADRLDVIPAAIETWSKVREEFGDEPETITALDQLLTAAGRFEELADVLDDAAATRRLGAGSLLSRMGEVHRVQLGNPQEATRLFAQALAVEPMDQTARNGLRELCHDDACRGPAAEALVATYRQTDEWEALLSLLEVRLQATDDPIRSVEILREAVLLQEGRGQDSAGALRSLARAFVIDPDAPSLEAELHRLADLCGDWRVAAEALGAAASKVSSEGRAAALLRAQGLVLEERLSDPGEAVAAYAAAARQAPDSFVIRRAIIRASALAGTWAEACTATVEISAGRKVVDADAVSSLANAAGAQDAFDKLTAALEQALAQAGDLPPAVARELHAQCARWQREEVEDLAAAQAAARRAAEADNGHRGTMQLLAELERGLPEAAAGPHPVLCDTLLALDQMSDRDLDALAEAAEVAVAAEADRAFTRDVVGRLYRKAARLFMQAEELAGERRPAPCALWALDQLVAMALAGDQRDEAIRLLLAATELPLPREQVLDLRLRAARLCRDSGDRPHAIELFQRVLTERPNDLQLLTELADLCEEEEQLLTLVTLRGRELDLTEDPDRRLQLRLSICALVGEVERQGGRVESLRANLGERPGHGATLEALTSVLGDKGKLDELADVLSEQAEALRALGQAERSAELWTDVAELVEDHFRDIDRAIEALKHVVDLAPSGEALDHLARLHLQRDDPAAAAAVLSQRLLTTEPTARVSVLLRLARAQIQAGQETDAIETLQTAFEEAPRSGEVRKLLIKLYREHEQWEPLARALSTAAQHVSDADTILAYAREAAEIYGDRLGQPDSAVPVLEQAHALQPDDRKIKARLGEGLRVAGRLDEAKAVLEALTAAFGRRRSAERAAAHLILARVAHAQGDRDHATDQLERASSMDPTNPTILQTLAEMAREGGQLERAERAYRALLIQARRQRGQDDEPTMGASEVLYELSRIAADRDDDEQAAELVESAMEALSEHETEGQAFAARLRGAGGHALLERVLDARMATASSPRVRAEVLGELALLQEDHLQQPEKALQSRLAALRADPASPEHHERARELAAKAGRLPEYVSAVERQLEKTRRTTDVYVRVELLLRLAEAMEAEGGDLGRAEELVGQAEALGVREVDVWRAAARIAGARGDTAKQMDYLERLADLGEQGTETRADALYRMAEVYLSQEDTVDKGIVVLSDALEAAPRHERACRILARATAEAVHNPELLALYDRVARKTGDAQVILQAIERRAQHSDTAPEDVREGVDLALRLDQPDRAEALMLRAIELAGALLDGDSRVGWALVAMARRRHDAGDAAGAVKWLCEAIEAGDELDTLVPLAKEITAAEGGDMTLSVKVFEALLERDATAPEVWRPLAELYRKLGDLDQLSRLVDDTVDGIEEPEERNALRLELAQTLLDNPNHESEAIDLLRGVLGETPDHEQAQTLLRQVLEKGGHDEELVALLGEQLLAAQQRGDREAVVDAALVLAAHQDSADPADAIQTLRSALDVAPDDERVLQRLLDLIGDADERRDERAEILEKLIGSASGEAAAELASALAQLHADADDEEAHLRALVLGYQRHPSSVELRSRLEKAYESRGDYRGLAQMLVTAADQEGADRLGLLRQAATIHRELLSDPETSADILEKAHAGTPDDAELALELASALAGAGKSERATTLVTGLLDDAELDGGIKMQLLATRADLRAAAGDVDGTVEDLEAALPFDTSLAPRLIEALDRARRAAQDGDDQPREREATLRLCELAIQHGDRDQARELLTAWVDKERKDVVALRQLRDLAAAEERWEAVAKISARLVAVETDDAQIDAALQLATACKAMGKPEDARAGLEHARRKQPDNVEIRSELREIYEATGATKELAKILAQEADEEVDVDTKVELMRRVADLFVELDETDAALPYIEQVLALQPGDPGATVTMADAYITMGEVDRADALLTEAIGDTKNKRSPTLALLFHRKARVAGARGDAQTQLALLQQAFSADKNNGQIAAELADLAEVLEVWDLAVRVLRTITLLDGPCPITRVQAFLRQAQICFRRGDRQRAVLWARKAKHEDPDDKEVTEFLASLGEG